MSLNNRLKALRAKQDSLAARIRKEWCSMEPSPFLQPLKIKGKIVKDKIAPFSQNS